MNASLKAQDRPRHDLHHEVRPAGSTGFDAMNVKLAFTGIGILAFLAGTAAYVGTRAPNPPAAAMVADVSPAVLLSARFADAQGVERSLGQFQGRLVVLNFWATWCGPCREEMPGFSRLQERWKDRGVQFVGISDEGREKVSRFTETLRVGYPLWTGQADVMALSRRLGNSKGVLPHTVILDGAGQVLETRVGLYAEADLEKQLSVLSAKKQ